MDVFLWAEERGLNVGQAWSQCYECYGGPAKQMNEAGNFGLRAQQAWANSRIPRLCDAMRDYFLDNPRSWEGSW